MNPRALLNNKARLLQWVSIMRQLRPSVVPEDIGNLVPWRYRFVTSIQDDKVVGVGAYFPTSSLVRGKYNYLADLVVDSNYRGKKVGESMMEEILASDLPCELDSGLEKVDAHRFYHRLGFLSHKYAVRLQLAAYESMSGSDFPEQQTQLIDGAQHLHTQDEDKLRRIQEFIEEHAALKVPHQANLKLFMKENPDHRLLIMQGDTDKLEGVLLFELQNRLSIGGNCFHVSDIIVKKGPGEKERQNALLISLVQKTKEYNSHDKTCSIRSVIVEMTEQETRSHKLLKGDGKDDAKSLADKIASPNAKHININSLFSVTAKHFIKAAHRSDQNILPLDESRHQQRRGGSA